MATNRISAVLSEADYEAANAGLNIIREKVPFLIDLTPKERTQLPRLGDQGIAFVEKALDIAKRNPEFLPRGFDINEMEKDFELFKKLFSLQSAVGELLEELQDTTVAAGSEAYVGALLIYGFVKADSGLTAGLEESADELGKRFIRKSRNAKKDAPPQK